MCRSQNAYDDDDDVYINIHQVPSLVFHSNGRLHRLLMLAMVPKHMRSRHETTKLHQESIRTQEIAQRLLPNSNDANLIPTRLSDDIIFCIYRLLMVMPWSTTSVVNTPTHISKILADRLGHTFDTTKTYHHGVRGVANWWTAWSANWITSLFMAWKSDASIATNPQTNPSTPDMNGDDVDTDPELESIEEATNIDNEPEWELDNYTSNNIPH